MARGAAGDSALRCPRAIRPGAPEWFANDDRGHYVDTIAVEGRTEHVLVDAVGPGALVRLWSANPDRGGTLRVRVDGRVVLEEPMAELMSGAGSVPPPLAAVRARGHNLYLPVPFQSHLQVTMDRSVGSGVYYAASWRSYPEDTVVQGLSEEVFDRERGAIDAAGAALTAPWPRVEPDVRTTATTDPDGRLVLELPPGPRALAELIVRVPPNGDLGTVWVEAELDGAASVEAPLGGLLGVGPGPVVPHTDFLRSVGRDGVLRTRWVVPYAERATWSLHNRGDLPLELSLEARTEPFEVDGRTLRFWAGHQVRELATRPHADWTAVVLPGRGRYVADTLAIDNPIDPWWGGGDEKIYVDGGDLPAVFGTGTEDYYGYAYCSNERFSAPWHGMPRNDQGHVRSGNMCRASRGRVANTRVRLLDTLEFRRGLRFDWEVWHWEDTVLHVEKTAVAYLAP